MHPKKPRAPAPCEVYHFLPGRALPPAVPVAKDYPDDGTGYMPRGAGQSLLVCKRSWFRTQGIDAVLAWLGKLFLGINLVGCSVDWQLGLPAHWHAKRSFVQLEQKTWAKIDWLLGQSPRLTGVS